MQTEKLNKMLQQTMSRGVRVWPLFAFTAVGLSAVALYNSVFTVDAGHRAVIFNALTGTRDFVHDEGTKLKIPFIEQQVIYDIRTKPRNIRAPTGSRDLQMVDIALRVLSKPVPEALPQIHKYLGPDYDDRVLPSIVNEVTKAVVAQYTASDLLVKREDVSREIKIALTERAKDFHITLDDVSITHLEFGREFRAAVEAKQVAQQEAERAKFLVMKAKQEKRSSIIRAMGEARSAMLIGMAVAQNPSFLRLRTLEAIRDIAEVMARSQNRVLLSADNLLLNTLAKESDELVTTGSSAEVKLANENFALLLKATEKDLVALGEETFLHELRVET